MVLVLGTPANRAAAPCELPLDPLPRALEKLGQRPQAAGEAPVVPRCTSTLVPVPVFRPGGARNAGGHAKTGGTASTPRLADKVHVHECRSAVEEKEKEP